MASSSRGWRSTIAAASAPANPGAPRTATLRTEGSSNFLERCLDRRAGARHILVGQRALRRAELEPERKRLASLTDLLAAVDVEQLDAVEQLAGAAPHDSLHLGRGHVLPDHDRDVLEQRRETGHVAVRLRAGREVGDQVRVELEGSDRPV